MTQTINTGSASDAWQYTYTEPDPLTAVVELNHPGTVRPDFLLWSIETLTVM